MRSFTLAAVLAAGAWIAAEPLAQSQTFDPRLPASVPAVSGPVTEQATLRYIEIQTGSGGPARPGQQYTVHYTGWLRDGTQFDSSAGKDPLKFVQGRREVIAGFDVGFEGMKIGGKRRIFIPYQLAYGEQQRGKITPKSELIFDIELLEAKDVPPAPATAADLLLPFTEMRDHVMALAKAIPEEKYGWRPAPGVRSIREVLLHIAYGNQLMLNIANNAPPKDALQKQIEENEKAAAALVSKDKVLQLLTESFEPVRTTLETARAAALNRPVDFFGESTTRRGVMASLDTHIAEHEGQLIAYARMNGIAPPWTLSARTAAPPLAAIHDHRETRHGATVIDNYFWLREKTNPEVVKYLESENAHTEASTATLKPFQEALYKEMLGRIKQTDLDVPVRRGEYLYYNRTVEGQQYPIRCRRKGAMDAPEEVLLDANELAKSHKFVGIGAVAYSDDGNLMAYTVDFTGFRQFALQVKDLRTGSTLPDTTERVTSLVWAADHKTLFLTTEDAVTKRSDRLWRHVLGTSAFEPVYHEKDELYDIGVGKTRDKQFILLGIEAKDTTEYRYLRAARPQSAFSVFLPRKKDHRYYVDHREGLFYIRTNRDGINFSVVTAPDNDPAEKNWKVFLAHRKDVLVGDLDLFRDFAVASEKTEAVDKLRVFSFRTSQWIDMQFPETVYSAFAGNTPEYTSTTYRYSYQSFVTPSSMYDFDVTTGTSKLLKRQEVLGNYDPTQYASERLWVTARDGTKVPVSIVYKKGFNRDGKGALFLYGYGSYGFGMSVTFSSSRLSLLDRGMAFAIAHIRGGDEMGWQWRLDGMLMKKKNTFFDFVDCAEYLVNEKWTSKDRLVIEGGSAGGLLMGAVVNLRPDLFRAVHMAVPFVDVMNTMMDATLPLTVGEYLEWGNPNEKAAYDYMKTYSPYDNLEKRAYPSMLVTTSFNDSQVMYWEPAKYVARLRTLKTDSNPLLLKIKMDPAGHGGASGRYDHLRDTAFEYAWLLSQAGIAK